MKFKINRDHLLEASQMVVGVVERKQTLPVLGNLLLSLEKDTLFITASDSEVQIQVSVQCESVEADGSVTVPARKLHDITKSLPEGCVMSLTLFENQVKVSAEQSNFVLSTLPAIDFPSIEAEEAQQVAKVLISQAQLKELINRTSFAMAIKDVRYYLNGALFELSDSDLKVVTTDGHRLATAQHKLATELQPIQSILPRKAVLELERLLEQNDETINIIFTDNVFSIKTNNFSFISRLIDGKFPDYKRVIPEIDETSRAMVCDRQQLKTTFLRVAILSNEKYRGVKVNVSDEILTISASNPDREEAEEKLKIEYSATEELKDIGFNVGYLLDVIDADMSKTIEIKLSVNNSAVIQQSSESIDALYVVMPMQL